MSIKQNHLRMRRLVSRKRGLCHGAVSPSVRPSACLSVTFVYFLETAKHILKLVSPDSPIILVFAHEILCRNSDRFPLTAALNAGGM